MLDDEIDGYLAKALAGIGITSIPDLLALTSENISQLMYVNEQQNQTPSVPMSATVFMHSKHMFTGMKPVVVVSKQMNGSSLIMMSTITFGVLFISPTTETSSIHLRLPSL